ncbi:hypothetical protein LINPERHAP1_LOCUS32222 [Linum perenne]
MRPRDPVPRVRAAVQRRPEVGGVLGEGGGGGDSEAEGSVGFDLGGGLLAA